MNADAMTFIYRDQDGSSFVRAPANLPDIPVDTKLRIRSVVGRRVVLDCGYVIDVSINGSTWTKI
jgi:hypothetical protein